jgi:hypothetical protein
MPITTIRSYNEEVQGKREAGRIEGEIEEEEAAAEGRGDCLLFKVGEPVISSTEFDIVTGWIFETIPGKRPSRNLSKNVLQT